MRLQQVDLNLFLVFDTIYNERNLTRAAEVLCITQPAVSNALARLRKIFDDPLFIRSARGMIPTTLANNIVNRTQEALNSLDSAIQQAHDFNPLKDEKELRISMTELAQTTLLPSLLQTLEKAAPNVTLKSFYVSRNQCAKELAAGTLDFAIDVPLPDNLYLKQLPLQDEPYVCAIRQDHPFNNQSMSLDDYLKLDHLLVSSRREGYGAVEYALNKLGKQRSIKARIQNYLAAPNIVSQTDLAWTLPSRMAVHLGLRTYALPFDMQALTWHLFWHKSADHDSANIWLRKLISTCTLDTHISLLHKTN